MEYYFLLTNLKNDNSLGMVKVVTSEDIKTIIATHKIKAYNIGIGVIEVGIDLKSEG